MDINANAVEHRKILVNSASNVLFYVIQVAVVFFVSPILVHGLGDNRYGAWTLVNSVTAYLALADLGIGAAVLRYVARFSGLRDEEAINRVFSTSLAIFTCAGAAVLAATSALVVFWTNPFGMTGGLAADMRWMIAMYGANLGILLPLGIYKTVLMGLGRYPLVNAVRIATLLLRNAGLVLVLHLGGGLREIAATIVAASLVDQAWCLLAAHRHLPSLRFALRYVDSSTLRAIWGYSVFIFLSVVVTKVSSETNALVIGTFLPTAAVAYFGIAAALWTQAGEGLRTAVAVLTPAVSKWESVGHRDGICRLLTTGTRYLLYLTAPLQVGLLFLGRPFLTLWMGPRYAEVCCPPLAILALSLSPALAMAMAARILEGVGKVAGLFWSNVAQSLLTVGLSLALVGPLGIEGVAWANAAPLALQSVLVIAVACRASDVRLATYFLGVLPLPAVAGGGLAFAWWATDRWLPAISSWPALFAAGLAGLALYFVLVLCLDSGLRRHAGQLQAALKPRSFRWPAVNGAAPVPQDE